MQPRPWPAAWLQRSEPELVKELLLPGGHAASPHEFKYRQKDAQVFDVTAVPDAGVITVPQGIPADVKRILRSYAV